MATEVGTLTSYLVSEYFALGLTAHLPPRNTLGLEAGAGEMSIAEEVPRQERVMLYLAGTFGSTTNDEVSRFIYQLTGLRADVMIDSGGSAEATIQGSGAYEAAARIEGQRCDADRRFDFLEMSNDWFCPCGHSGCTPLSFVDSCPACGAERPAGLRQGAELAAQAAGADGSAAAGAAPPSRHGFVCASDLMRATDRKAATTIASKTSAPCAVELAPARAPGER